MFNNITSNGRLIEAFTNPVVFVQKNSHGAPPASCYVTYHKTREAEDCQACKMLLATSTHKVLASMTTFIETSTKRAFFLELDLPEFNDSHTLQGIEPARQRNLKSEILVLEAVKDARTHGVLDVLLPPTKPIGQWALDLGFHPMLATDYLQMLEGRADDAWSARVEHPLANYDAAQIYGWCEKVEDVLANLQPRVSAAWEVKR